MSPEYINENWTDELLSLMLMARAERFTRGREEACKPPSEDEDYKPQKNLPATGLAAKMAAFGSRVMKVTKR